MPISFGGLLGAHPQHPLRSAGQRFLVFFPEMLFMQYVYFSLFSKVLKTYNPEGQHEIQAFN